jgi:alpha-mannosidase
MGSSVCILARVLMMMRKWVPEHHRDITLGRLASALSKESFSDVNITSQLWSARTGDPGCVSLSVWSVEKGKRGWSRL